MNKEALPFDQGRIIEQARLSYSPLRKDLDNIMNQSKRQMIFVIMIIKIYPMKKYL